MVNVKYLSTDNKLYLSIFISIKILVYSEDLIDSLTMPNIGVKVDTNPGRINSQISTLLKEDLY